MKLKEFENIPDKEKTELFVVCKSKKRILY